MALGYPTGRMPVLLGLALSILLGAASLASAETTFHRQRDKEPAATPVPSSGDDPAGTHDLSVRPGTEQWRNRVIPPATPSPTPAPVAAPISVPDIAPAESASSCPAVGFVVPDESPSGANSLAATLGVRAQVLDVYANNAGGGPYTAFTFGPRSGFQLLLGVGAVTPAQATTIGRNLVAEGYSNTMIRIMWEMNGNWFPWGTQAYSAAQYISIYQAAERAFAAVPGNHFTYIWSLSAGTVERGRSEFDTYPGSAYVSNVGFDVYNWWGDDNNIPAIIDFAHSVGKPVSINEWGVAGLDDPGFVDTISDYVHNPANDITEQSYFSEGSSTITQFPAAEAEYRKDFSSGC